MTEKEPWAYQLDWLNIVSILRLDSIEQIPEIKRERVIKKISKLYGAESLLSFNPSELDELVANELRELMKKELIILARRREKIEKQLKSKMFLLKNPRVNEIKDMNPDELFKYLSNKMMGKKEDDDDQDDDQDKYNEDKNSYYI